MSIKTFTPAQFDAFLARTDWARTTESEVTSSDSRETYDEDGDCIFIPHTSGWASITSTLDGVTITHSEGWSYDDHEPDTLSASSDGMDEPLTIEGAVIVDEDGDDYAIGDFWKELREHSFTDIDYGFLSIKGEPEDIDMGTDSNMDIITIDVDNAPSLRFKGELIARTSSSANDASSDYSGSTGRWTELELYKTAAGRYVCRSIGRTQWQGENDRHTAKVCDTLDDVKEFFGYRWLAKDLYDEAGIDYAETVE